MFKPRIFPVKGDVAPAEIDRAQSIDPTATLNREKVEEIGREGTVGYLKKSPTIAYRLTQLEYGNIEFWQKLVNTAVKGNIGEDAITMADFKTPYSDICAYLTDDDNTFKGTIWYPSLRTSGFSLTIGDPQARIERSFDMVGESAVIWQGTNKYFIYNKHEVSSGDDNEIDLTAIPPAVDPDNAGVYILRVVRVRSGISTELTSGTDYTYSNVTKILTITSITTADIIKTYYTSATAPADIFTPNDSDVPGLIGDCASIYLYIPASGHPASGDYIYRLQNVTIDVAFDREDIREIGNKNVVARGVRNTTVTVTLGRILEAFTIEEVLRGEVTDYGKIDVEKLTDSAALIVKIFDDNTKTTFKYGFKATGLSAMELRGGAAINEYVKADNTLEGEDLSITSDETVLGI